MVDLAVARVLLGCRATEWTCCTVSALTRLPASVVAAVTAAALHAQAADQGIQKAVRLDGGLRNSTSDETLIMQTAICRPYGSEG
jgi:hypothetical protein